MIFDTSAIEQTHGFALFLRSWWMEARDIPAGLRQSVTSLVYKLCTDILFIRLHFENSFVQCSEFLICKLRSKSRVSSDHVGMKNISGRLLVGYYWLICHECESFVVFVVKSWTMYCLVEVFVVISLNSISLGSHTQRWSLWRKPQDPSPSFRFLLRLWL